jgi:FkbM family methyltransferase
MLPPSLKHLLGKVGLDSENRHEIRRRFSLQGLKDFRSYRKARAFHTLFLEEGDLVFDVGANIGSRTNVYLSLGARVVAIEPVDECLQQLLRKFKNRSNLNIVPQALGKAEGRLPIFACSDNLTISSMSPHWIAAVKESGRFRDSHWKEQRPVSVTTLDILIGQYGTPAFIKIDVEGFELDVLKGLSQVVDLISFEFTPEFLQMTEQCVKYLAELSADNHRFNYVVGEAMEFSLEEWVDSATIVELIRELPFEIFGDVYARSS